MAKGGTGFHPSHLAISIAACGCPAFVALKGCQCPPDYECLAFERLGISRVRQSVFHSAQSPPCSSTKFSGLPLNMAFRPVVEEKCEVSLAALLAQIQRPFDVKWIGQHITAPPMITQSMLVKFRANSANTGSQDSPLNRLGTRLRS